MDVDKATKNDIAILLGLQQIHPECVVFLPARTVATLSNNEKVKGIMEVIGDNIQTTRSVPSLLSIVDPQKNLNRFTEVEFTAIRKYIGMQYATKECLHNFPTDILDDLLAQIRMPVAPSNMPENISSEDEHRIYQHCCRRLSTKKKEARRVLKGDNRIVEAANTFDDIRIVVSVPRWLMLSIVLVFSFSLQQSNAFIINSGKSRWNIVSRRTSSRLPDSAMPQAGGGSSKLTDWVVENLESEGSSITSSSTVKAGENDSLPESGLCIGKVRILAADSTFETDEDDLEPIKLLVGRNGWGTGVHPTTRLCLEWICDVVQGGETVLDYGCGSGVLSIASLHMGAARCVGVDVEAEALVTAERNLQLNGYDEGRFEGLHTREVLPYDICPTGVDLVVANILIGQLVRPSMVAAIVSNMASGGLLCLSGIRPNEVDSLKKAYADHIEWVDDQYAELSATETEGSLESYGFDCGRWARVVGRKVSSDGEDIEAMSELAVS